MAERDNNIKREEEDLRKESLKRNKKSLIKKLIYFSTIVFILLMVSGIIFFSIQVRKPTISKVPSYSDSTFLYELEYYLVELGFYKLHSSFSEPPLIEIKFLDNGETISVMVKDNSLIIKSETPKNPDISIYTYKTVVESLRKASSKAEMIKTVKKDIKEHKIVILLRKDKLKLALKGYLSLAYLIMH